jgi:hypothetical protein
VTIAAAARSILSASGTDGKPACKALSVPNLVCDRQQPSRQSMISPTTHRPQKRIPQATSDIWDVT